MAETIALSVAGTDGTWWVRWEQHDHAGRTQARGEVRGTASRLKAETLCDFRDIHTVLLIADIDVARPDERTLRVAADRHEIEQAIGRRLGRQR